MQNKGKIPNTKGDVYWRIGKDLIDVMDDSNKHEMYIWVILVSIVPFESKKWPRLFLSSCLVKLLEINTEISIDHALFVLLKSGFYILPFMNSTGNKLVFPSFSRVFMMVPQMFLFFPPFFPAWNKTLNNV